MVIKNRFLSDYVNSLRLITFVGVLFWLIENLKIENCPLCCLSEMWIRLHIELLLQNFSMINQHFKNETIRSPNKLCGNRIKAAMSSAEARKKQKTAGVFVHLSVNLSV